MPAPSGKREWIVGLGFVTSAVASQTKNCFVFFRGGMGGVRYRISKKTAPAWAGPVLSAHGILDAISEQEWARVRDASNYIVVVGGPGVLPCNRLYRLIIGASFSSSCFRAFGSSRGSTFEHASTRR